MYIHFAARYNGVIAGGHQNFGLGFFATIGGGAFNTAGTDERFDISSTSWNGFAVVGGGILNVANGTMSVVGGGSMNTAKGFLAVCAGGGTDYPTLPIDQGEGGGSEGGNDYASPAPAPFWSYEPQISYDPLPSYNDFYIYCEGFGGPPEGNKCPYYYLEPYYNFYYYLGPLSAYAVEIEQARGRDRLRRRLANSTNSTFSTTSTTTTSTTTTTTTFNLFTAAATVGANKALGDWSVVSGGGGNTASGQYANVAGGANNLASGNAATIVGGVGNTAVGQYSLVLGSGGRVVDDYAVLFSFVDPASMTNGSSNSSAVCQSAGPGTAHMCTSTGLYVTGGLYVNILPREFLCC